MNRFDITHLLGPGADKPKRKKKGKTLTVYAVVKVEIAPRDGKRYPADEAAGYLHAAFDRALRECDPMDRIVDLSAFGPGMGQANPADVRLCRELLDEKIG